MDTKVNNNYGIIAKTLNDNSVTNNVVQNNFVTSNLDIYNNLFPNLKELLDLIADSDLEGNVTSVIDQSSDLIFLEKSQKNIINNLSEPYFQNILMDDIYFINEFQELLRKPENITIVDLYQTQAKRLKVKANALLTELKSFDLVFDRLLDSILSSGKHNDTLLIKLLHFMYYYCDIGDKTEEERR